MRDLIRLVAIQLFGFTLAKVFDYLTHRKHNSLLEEQNQILRDIRRDIRRKIDPKG